jgi:phosphate-selective porin
MHGRSIGRTARRAAAALLFFAPLAARAAEPGTPPPAVHLGDKGVELRSPHGNWFANVDLRAQLRYTNSRIDERSLGGDERTDDEAELNRARLKIGGHAGRPWFTYYYEHDLVDDRVLDLRVTVERVEWLQLRAGQWKIPFNRERVDSSGNQQFVERSIATQAFTLDRQRGAAAFGRVAAGTAADGWYNVGVYEPLGRDGRGEYDDPLLLARWQWNFLGRDLGFSQGDVGYRAEPAASIALAGARYRGPYTAFSSSGGGQLEGFERGDRDRYAVEQLLFETAWQHRGASWQHEWHRKRVRDTQRGRTTVLQGGYAQAGLFLHAVWPAVPKPLEVAVRYAEVDPDTGAGDDLQREAALGLNWFFDGHRHKLSADVSRLTDDAGRPGRRKETRLRLQWDVSLRGPSAAAQR